MKTALTECKGTECPGNVPTSGDFAADNQLFAVYLPLQGGYRILRKG